MLRLQLGSHVPLLKALNQAYLAQNHELEVTQFLIAQNLLIVLVLCDSRVHLLLGPSIRWMHQVHDLLYICHSSLHLRSSPYATLSKLS